MRYELTANKPTNIAVLTGCTTTNTASKPRPVTTSVRINKIGFVPEPITALEYSCTLRTSTDEEFVR